MKLFFRSITLSLFLIMLTQNLFALSILGSGTPESFAKLVEKVSPAVVNIYTTKTPRIVTPFTGVDPYFDQFFKDQFTRRYPNKTSQQQHSLGTGFIISDICARWKVTLLREPCLPLSIRSRVQNIGWASRHTHMMMSNSMQRSSDCLCRISAYAFSKAEITSTMAHIRWQRES
mgnify:CR=1 FL=1